MRRLRVLLAGACAVALGSGCASQLTPAAAVVGGVKIPETWVEDELALLRDDVNYRRGLAQAGPEYRGEERRRILSTLIHIRLVEAELQRRGQPVNAREVDGTLDRLAVRYGGRERLRSLVEQENLSPERFRELTRRQTAIEKLQRLLTADQRPDPEQVQAAYEAARANYRQARLSRITVADRDAAARIVDEVDSPEAFAREARRSSSDEAASRGGDIAWVDLRLVDEATRTELEAVPDGGVAGPVQAGGSFQVYLVHERRTAPLEDVRDEIEDALLLQAREQAIGRFLRAKLAREAIRVNPKYGRFDREQLAVVPAPDRLSE